MLRVRPKAEEAFKRPLLAAARRQPSLNSRLEYKPNFDYAPTLPAQLARILTNLADC
jgi:hypothetical protein